MYRTRPRAKTLSHIALYAGAKGYPRRATPDPRHFPFLHGSARSVERLGGKWAPSASYGRDLVQLVRTLVARSPSPPKPRPAPPVLAPSPPPVPLGFLRARGTSV